jgi:site-specific recombinase XerD
LQISEARERYIRWLLATRDLSPHTIRAYDGDLISLERHLDPSVEVVELGRESLISFIEAQKACFRQKLPEQSGTWVAI